jgi:hypothetical protein
VIAAQVDELVAQALGGRKLCPRQRRRLAGQLRAVCELPAGSGPMAGLKADLEAAADVLDPPAS